MMSKKVVAGIAIGIAVVLIVGTAMPLVVAKPEELLVHSGAGLSETMDVLSKKFEDEYGIKVTVNYGGAASLLTQMELKREGDIFIPGGRHTFNRAKEKGFIEGQEEFVAYHIPVIGVPKGNPANITCLEDLAKPGVKVALGDPKSVPIGKKAERILKKNGIYEEVMKNVVSLEGEEPMIVKDVRVGDVDAGIFWRSSIIGTRKFIEIIEIPKEKNAIDVIPIGVLIFSKDKEAARKFMDFVVSEKGVWESNGYVTYPNEKYGLVEGAPTPTPAISPEATPTPTLMPTVTPQGDFSIRVEPKHVDIKPGDSITFELTISPIGEFDAPIELNISITAPLYNKTYSLPTQYPPYPKTYTYTVNIPEDVPPCTARGIITATGGGKTHTDIATVKIPGFEAISAIAGLLAVAYLLMREMRQR